MHIKLYSSFFTVISATLLMLSACGDDKSSSAIALPDEVTNKAELSTYECNGTVIGEKVFVTDLGKNYECDGDEWFESFDQPKSGTKVQNSSSSRGSSSSNKLQSSSSKISESDVDENQTCTEEPACDAMDKSDVNTWHFVRNDAFGGDAEYIYKASGKDLIVTIKNADGSTNSNTYSMYNMESEVGVEMAFRAAKATCEDGGGNEKMVKVCVAGDALPAKIDCDAAHEGLFRLIEDGYEVCKNSAWVSAKEEVAETNGESCSAEDIGRVIDGKLTNANKYYCAEKGWINAKRNWESLPRDVHLNPDIKYDSIVDERDGKVYKIVKIGEQVWMAQNLAYEVEGSGRCVEYRGCFYDWVTTVGAPGCGNEYCGGTSNGKIQGVCPEGWHVPTLAEWKQLLDFVGGDDVEVEKRLMSKTAWRYATGVSDTVGFSALPLENTEAGRYSGGNWYARFWSATGRFSGDAYDLMIFADKAYSLAGSYKSLGLSVRCIKDDDFSK